MLCACIYLLSFELNVAGWNVHFHFLFLNICFKLSHPQGLGEFVQDENSCTSFVEYFTHIFKIQKTIPSIYTTNGKS